MAESELTSPKESLSDQFVIMQELYVELEQEREASATAASEALSMILRLQGEKAAEKLEAYHYKRMAEEKIHHAEESLGILEELLYQKEMEIASLRFEVQTYRDRLSKPGTSPTSSGMCVSKIPPLRKPDAFRGYMSSTGTLRSISLPVMRSTDKCSEMDIIDEEVFSLQTRQPALKHLGNLVKNVNDKGSARTRCSMLLDFSGESPTSNCNVGDDQIANKQKNKMETSGTRRMKENIKSACILEHRELQMSMPIASISSGNGYISCSWSSTMSSSTFCDSTIEVAETKLGIEDLASSCSESDNTRNYRDFDSHYSSYLESELPRTMVHSLSVHDIFEVPQYGCHDEPQNELFTGSFQEKDDASSTFCSITKKVTDNHFKDECLTNEVQDGQCGTMFYVPRKGVGLNYSWDPSAEEFWQADVRQLEKRLQVLEDERRTRKQEDSERNEQLKLLKEISEQITMIQSQIKKPPAKKNCNQDDILLVSIMEAMLSFSI